MRTRHAPVAFLLLALPLVACDQQGAWGDANSIVAVAPADLWAEVQDTVYSALEPTIWTVRSEKTFTVTYMDPTDPQWRDLRRFKQLLLIGPRGAPWIDDALAAANRDARNVVPPAVVQVNNVWARAQLVTVLLTPETGLADAVRAELPDLQALYDRQYRQWAVNRMFVSGRDTALADTLAGEAGFSLLVPEVYYWDRQDSVYIFRNDNPDPAELIRQVAVTWMSPMPMGMEADDFLSWRTDVVEKYYSYPQVNLIDDARAEAFEYRGREAYQIQAIWQNPPDSGWPAAGPFILRAVRCPSQDRLYLIDAWLYAPDREKYEYMIQLQTILDSFECGVT